MARELTPKQQKFANEYLACGNASEAYRRAYDCRRMNAKTIGRNAQAALKNNGIATYLASIKKPAQAKVAAKFEVTLETVTAMLLKDRRDAEELEKTPAAVSCSRETAMALAKLHGLVTDKVKLNAEGPVLPVLNVSVGPAQHQSAPKAGDSSLNTCH